MSWSGSSSPLSDAPSTPELEYRSHFLLYDLEEGFTFASVNDKKRPRDQEAETPCKKPSMGPQKALDEQRKPPHQSTGALSQLETEGLAWPFAHARPDTDRNSAVLTPPSISREKPPPGLDTVESNLDGTVLGHEHQPLTPNIVYPTPQSGQRCAELRVLQPFEEAIERAWDADVPTTYQGFPNLHTTNDLHCPTSLIKQPDDPQPGNQATDDSSRTRAVKIAASTELCRKDTEHDEAINAQDRFSNEPSNIFTLPVAQTTPLDGMQDSTLSTEDQPHSPSSTGTQDTIAVHRRIVTTADFDTHRRSHRVRKTVDCYKITGNNRKPSEPCGKRSSIGLRIERSRKGPESPMASPYHEPAASANRLLIKIRCKQLRIERATDFPGAPAACSRVRPLFPGLTREASRADLQSQARRVVPVERLDQPRTAPFPTPTSAQPDFGIDPELYVASCTIMAKTALLDKPEPQGQPEVWSDSRASLCETLLYYQAWQGACYTLKGNLYSFMFDSNGHARDLIDGDVVIARAGGGMGRDSARSELVQCKDQKDNAQMFNVRQSIVQQNPIIILCGSENTNAPSRMPHRYCVLGWFKVTHAWSERSQAKSTKTASSGYEIIKYRFEKLNTSQPSWWLPKNSKLSISVGDFDPPVEACCRYCRKTHQQIYLGGWTCLTSACEAFWTWVVTPADEDLHYDPRFLKQRTAWDNELPPYDIRPPLPEPGDEMGDDVTFAMTRGICCPVCGKCTSRYLWKGWKCTNPVCSFELIPTHTLITAKTIRDPYHPISQAYAQSVDSAAAHVTTSVSFSHNYRIMQYRFDGIKGLVTHMIANEVVNKEGRGPDEMFEALQTLETGLERRHFASGEEDFMTAFSGNWGMPYKFQASGSSKPFNGAPWPVTETRTRLNWAAKNFSGISKMSISNMCEEDGFNELLAFGYFQGQDIKYHDDGERGLGETVATLSLGAPAQMEFRVKGKHFTGVKKTGSFVATPPLPGTAHYEARKAACEQLLKENVPATDRNKRLVEIAQELGLRHVCNLRKRSLRLRLAHGDIVIMHGRQIQEYMEHQVEPKGPLRFALTCRTILADHLRPDELPSYPVRPDDGFYDGSAIVETRVQPEQLDVVHSTACPDANDGTVSTTT